MTSIQWGSVTNAIFFTTTDMGWEKNWDIIMFNEEPVTDINLAKQLVREYMKGANVGLATYEQMLLNNAEWDNF